MSKIADLRNANYMKIFNDIMEQKHIWLVSVRLRSKDCSHPWSLVRVFTGDNAETEAQQYIKNKEDSFWNLEYRGERK